MTDQKRDESRDIGVTWKEPDYEKNCSCHINPPCSYCVDEKPQPLDPYRWEDCDAEERYIPHRHLVAAEERGKRWREALHVLLMKLNYHNVEPCRHPVTGLDLNEFDNLRMAMRDAESEMMKW